MNQLTKPKNLGLYVHIPFCLQKCNYCDFTSFAARPDAYGTYVNALICEIWEYREQMQPYMIDTVFIGGGTPTALPQELLCRIIEALFACFPIQDDCEFTVECNPKTAGLSYLKALKARGVNRVSLGAQSFAAHELALLGRIHTTQDIEKSVSNLHAAGIQNYNLDLMFGFYGQTEETLHNSLERALALDPPHLSVYSLILEEGTPFYDMDKSLLPDEKTERKMDALVHTLLPARRYERYEISNYAKAGYECRHNIKYWTCGQYLGLGLGAHSYLGGVRFYNTSSLPAYLSKNYRTPLPKPLSATEQMGEFIIMGLRMMRGISYDDFYRRFHMDLRQQCGPQITRHLQNGLLEESKGFLRLTPRGIEISNYVMCDFL